MALHQTIMWSHAYIRSFTQALMLGFIMCGLVTLFISEQKPLPDTAAKVDTRGRQLSNSALIERARVGQQFALRQHFFLYY